MDSEVKDAGLEELDIVTERILTMAKNRICLFTGPMGSGKTTLIRNICSKLGVTDNVASPTYALVNEYASANGPIYHFDFYRLDSLEEALDAGVEEYFYSGNLCLIEWPELVADILPDDCLLVKIEDAGTDKRNYKMTLNGFV